MLAGTLVINIVAMLVIFVLEFNNPRTLANLPAMGKVLGAYFQAVSPRTAGFNSIDISGLEDATVIFMVLLMFIGAVSASTGGGIKLTTFLVITFSVFAFLRQRKEIRVFRRKIDETYIYKSLAISMISAVLVFTAMFLLTISEKGTPFIQILFEVVSAFGTGGLSMGLTFNLSEIGKCIIIFVMFAGKLGPLTLAFSLAKPGTDKISYPKEDILTG
ncbi:potassium transporter TrkG [Bacillus sp. AK031]